MDKIKLKSHKCIGCDRAEGDDRWGDAYWVNREEGREWCSDCERDYRQDIADAEEEVKP